MGYRQKSWGARASHIPGSGLYDTSHYLVTLTKNQAETKSTGKRIILSLSYTALASTGFGGAYEEMMNIRQICAHPLWRRLPGVLLAGLVSGCNGLQMLDALTPQSGYTVQNDIVFQPGPRGKMDFYTPSPGTATGRPGVIFFYGGGWQDGKRQDYRFIGQSLAEAGYRVAIPDYRLFPEVRYPQFLNDSAAAVRYARTVWGAETPLVLVGHSAGGHIVLMLALDPDYLGADRQALAGVIALAAPADFEPDEPYRTILDYDRVGRAALPIGHIRADTPPLLLLHGEADSTVYPRNSRTLAAALKAAGAPVETIFYPGVSHSGIIGAMSPALSFLAPARADVLAFLTRLQP
jgi:acetyl esterase/lipase